jgi:putative acetyltransferase
VTFRRIVNYRPEHARAFAELNRAWLVENDLLEPLDEQQLQNPEGEILAPGGQIFVAIRGNEVLGTCAAIPHGPGVFELAKLAVSSNARGQGLGRKLVTACLSYARKRNASRLVLVSNSRLRPALQLYETFGFQHRQPPSPLPYSTADVYMELDLDSGE